MILFVRFLIDNLIVLAILDTNDSVDNCEDFWICLTFDLFLCIIYV